MDGDKIKKKLLNYARDYAFEKINKTLDKKLANTNGNQSSNSDSNQDESLRSSIGGRPHVVSCKKMTPRSSRYMMEPTDRRSILEDDEVVIRSLRRPRVRLSRDQRDRFSRVRSEEDSFLDDGDEDDDVSTGLMKRTPGKQRILASAVVEPRSARSSPVHPPRRVRSDRGSGGSSQTNCAPQMITSLGECDSNLYLKILWILQ